MGAASAIAAGDDHTCAIREGSGAVVCWGADADGQASPPLFLNGVQGHATAIAAGTGYSLAIQTWFECDDQLDNDGDGLVDFPDDPGCTAPDGETESPACDDGADNDGDGRIDDADPGCPFPAALLEDPVCDDGLDNDGDGEVDFADPHCTAAWPYSEHGSCGLGAELVGLLALAMWLEWRKSPRV
jgi:hypothetical protein